MYIYITIYLLVNSYEIKKDLTEEENFKDIANSLLPIVKNCLYMKDDETLTLDEDFIATKGWPNRVGTGGVITDAEKEKNLFSKRLFYSIKMIYGIEFSKKLIDYYSSVQSLATQVSSFLFLFFLFLFLFLFIHIFFCLK